MPLFANNFLAGGIISLLFPVLLLLAIWTWYWYSAKRIGHDESRPDEPVAAQTDAPAAAGAPAGAGPQAARAGASAGAETQRPAGP